MMHARTESSAPTNPLQLLAIGTRFAEAKVVLTALKKGLFATLGDGRMSADELREALGLHPRPAPAFFGVLVELGLLRKIEDSLENSAAVCRYLIPGRPEYIGGFLRRADEVLYPAWEALGTALVTGQPQAGHRQGNPFTEVMEMPEQLLRFLDMIDVMNSLVAPTLSKALDWSSARTIADIGGARGNLAAALVTDHPHLTATVFDLPAMRQPFVDHMYKLGTTGKVSFLSGDFFADPLPSADVLIVGHVLHDWGNDECRRIVRAAYDALPSGGTLAIYDIMLDDDLSGDMRKFKLTVSLHMLLTTEHGREYAVSDCAAWCVEAGFTKIKKQRLGYLDTLVSAVKL